MLQKQVVKEYMENAVYDFIDDDGIAQVRDLEADAINFFNIGDDDYDNQDLILDVALEVSKEQEQVYCYVCDQTSEITDDNACPICGSMSYGYGIKIHA